MQHEQGGRRWHTLILTTRVSVQAAANNPSTSAQLSQDGVRRIVPQGAGQGRKLTPTADAAMSIDSGIWDRRGKDWFVVARQIRAKGKEYTQGP